MDLVHHIYRLVLGGKLYPAPIGDNPQRVLDLGTGTGIWATDFAEQVSIYGCFFSLASYKPLTFWIPVNIHPQKYLGLI